MIKIPEEERHIANKVCHNRGGDCATWIICNKYDLQKIKRRIYNLWMFNLTYTCYESVTQVLHIKVLGQNSTKRQIQYGKWSRYLVVSRPHAQDCVWLAYWNIRWRPKWPPTCVVSANEEWVQWSCDQRKLIYQPIRSCWGGLLGKQIKISSKNEASLSLSLYRGKDTLRCH